MTGKRLKLKRRTEAKPGEVSVAFVQRAIMEMMEAHGLLHLQEWKANVDHQLHVMRVIFHDMQDAVGLAQSADSTSARSRLQELLEQLGKSLTSVEEIILPEEARPTHETNAEILQRIFQQDAISDQYGEDVETEDFHDPLDDLMGG